MRRLTLLIGGAFLATIASAGTSDVNARWFDYRNCDFCKQWAMQPGLIEHSHDECHNISDGIIWVESVDAGYRNQYAKTLAAEQNVLSDLQAGKPVSMCRYCSAINDFSRKGVRIESVSSDAGEEITIYTSSDSTLVKQIQSFGLQAIGELARANAAFVAGQKKGK